MQYEGHVDLHLSIEIPKGASLLHVAYCKRFQQMCGLQNQDILLCAIIRRDVNISARYRDIHLLKCSYSYSPFPVTVMQSS